jgi:hypothetical protein
MILQHHTGDINGITADLSGGLLGTCSHADSRAAHQILVQNTSADSAWLGPQDVSTSNGYELVADASVAFDLPAGDGLYAVGDVSGHPDLHVTVIIGV